MTTLISIIAFLFIVGLVIFIHELGHFLAAKFSGVVVKEFALGFGPKVIGRRYKETDYSLRLFPLGGYVQLLGENEADALLPGSFWQQPLYRRVIILLAGVVMNFLLAILVSIFYLNSVGHKVPILKLGGDYPFIGINQSSSFNSALYILEVDKDGAASGKIKEGELIIGFDGKVVSNTKEFLNQVNNSRGKTIKITLTDLEQTYKKEVEVQLGSDPKKSAIGIAFREFYLLVYRANLASGFAHAVNVFGYQVASLAELVGQSVEAGDASIVTDQFASPVAIGVIIGDIVVSEQYRELMNLIIIINLALAFFNVLPLPALDGGQVAIAVIEKIRRKRFSMRTIEWINVTGFVLFTGLGLLVIAKDVVQFEIINNVIAGLRSVIGR